jgi:hypothetical protein
MKRLELADIKEEWGEIFRMMDRKELQLTQKEVQAEVEVGRSDLVTQRDRRIGKLHSILSKFSVEGESFIMGSSKLLTMSD